MKYRLLYFQDNVLVEWEALEVDDPMAAIETASARTPHLTVELWSDRQKVAVFRPARTRRPI